MRVIDSTTESQLGVMTVQEGVRLAKEKGLDLFEIALNGCGDRGLKIFQLHFVERRKTLVRPGPRGEQDVLLIWTFDVETMEQPMYPPPTRKSPTVTRPV